MLYWLILWSCAVQSLGEDIRTTGQSAVDQVKGATKPYGDAAADKTQAARDSLTSSNQATTGSKGISGPGSVSGADHFGAALLLYCSASLSPTSGYDDVSQALACTADCKQRPPLFKSWLHALWQV